MPFNFILNIYPFRREEPLAIFHRRVITANFSRQWQKPVIIMCVLISQHLGWLSFASLIGLQFTFSIMFPTIFGLGLRNIGDLRQIASSFITMGVVGGAVFPIFMGWVADKTNVATAYLMPILCYVVILVFALKFYKPKEDSLSA